MPETPRSLRDVTMRRSSRRVINVLRFLPLVILLIITLVLAGLGIHTKLQDRSAGQADVADTAEFLERTGGDEPAPECLSRSFTAGPSDIWSGQDAETAEAVFAQHPEAAELGVRGRNGFFFLGDMASLNISQALGRMPRSDEQRADWLGYFTDLEARLAQDGRNLLLLVVPAKWELYPENLPEWMDELRGETHLDQFLAYAGSLPVVDVRDALRTAKDRAPVFSAVNSHWTPYAADAAWRQIQKCGAALYPELDWPSVSLPTVIGVSRESAPNEFTALGDTGEPEDWTVPEYEQPLPLVTVTRTHGNGSESVSEDAGVVDMLNLPATTRNAEGVGTALVLRDSTGMQMSSPIAATFGATCQIRHNLDAPEEQRPDVLHEARQCGADTVVYMFTQRYFAQFPPSIGEVSNS